MTVYMYGQDSTELDSIYHPSLDLLYIIEDDEIFLMRSKNAFAHTPFVSSHHNYYLYFQTLKIKREKEDPEDDESGDDRGEAASAESLESPDEERA